MKRFFLGLTFLTVGFGGVVTLDKCSGKSEDYTKHPADTTQTFVNFVVPLQWQMRGIQGNTAVTTLAWRFTKDTLMFDSLDANTLTKQWRRDTFYAFEIHLPPRDTTKGKRDSVVYYTAPPKYILQDFNKNPNKP